MKCWAYNYNLELLQHKIFQLASLPRILIKLNYRWRLMNYVYRQLNNIYSFQSYFTLRRISNLWIFSKALVGNIYVELLRSVIECLP